MRRELPETSTGGKMAIVVVPQRVVLVELKGLGYILDLEPVDLVHGFNGGGGLGGEENRGDNTESKDKITPGRK